MWSGEWSPRISDLGALTATRAPRPQRYSSDLHSPRYQSFGKHSGPWYPGLLSHPHLGVQLALLMQTPGTENGRTPDNGLHTTQHDAGLNTAAKDNGLHTIQNDAGLNRAAKRQRLSLACNECRKRKVKCDSEMPKCRNCRIRGNICETTDPKHPELVVIRKYGAIESDLHQHEHRTAPEYPMPSAAQYEPRPNTPISLPREQSSSWVARSYQAHRTLNSVSTSQATELTPDGAEAPNRLDLDESHDSPEITVNIDSNNNRQKVMGGSSLQSLSMFLDLYLRKSGLPGITSSFRHGMGFAEEYLLPLTLSLPDLPPSSLMDRYVDTFSRNIHPLYPVLDLEQLHAEIRRIRSYQDASWSPSGGFSGLRYDCLISV